MSTSDGKRIAVAALVVFALFGMAAGQTSTGSPSAGAGQEAARRLAAKKEREYQGQLRLERECRAKNDALLKEVLAKSTFLAGTDTAYGSLSRFRQDLL